MKKIIYLFILFSTIAFPQSWKIVGSMPIPVYGGQAVVKDSMIYILGGFSDSTNGPVNYIQQYNPRDSTWKNVGKMNVARDYFVASLYNNNIIYFGGAPDSMMNDSLEMWDGNSSHSLYGNDQNFNRSFSTGVVAGNNIYVFGGFSLGMNSHYMFEYNIPSSKIVSSYDSNFTQIFPTGLMSVLLGSNIYLFGGVSGLGTLQRSIVKFDTTDKIFSLISASLDKPRARGVAVAVGNEIYIIGGIDEHQQPLSSVYVFNPDNSNSEDVGNGPELNDPRTDLMAVNYYGSIYVFGGVGGDKDQQPVASIEKLDIITGIPNNHTQIANGFKLNNNYPNPFNPSTQISFSVGKDSHVSIDIYSILGQHIKNLASKNYSVGNYQITWDGTDNYGRQVAAGIYIYRLSSDYFTDSKKMVLMK
ncbi:MAG: Kelch repeat-containing protein [Ignavibacteriaceae bacterium]